ncbi:MAG: TIGR03960 family B12-binding radical SAM protein [Nitrospirota bacterium]
MSRKLREKAKNILNKEEGTIYKGNPGLISVALAYPNRYFVGMSNLGLQSIYSILNRRGDTVAERVFLPDMKDINEYKRTDTRLFSLESQRMIIDFDILAFSVSFENDYPNILSILSLSGIPLESSERGDEYPLVIAGGVCTFFNPEPISGFVDLFIIGEGEEVIMEFMDLYGQLRSKGHPRNRMLSSLAQIEGIYVPGLYSPSYNQDGTIKGITAGPGLPQRIKKRWIREVDSHTTKTCIRTPDTEFGDMSLIEISRGCKWSCRFCLEGYVYRPLRFRDLKIISKEIRGKNSAIKKIGLVGATVSSYPYFKELFRSLRKDGEGIKISVSSLRADSLSPDLLMMLTESGHKTIALAPEAGSERLRRLINKKLSDEDILKGIEMILRSDIPNIKLYFMIGLPTETTNDIDAILILTRRAQEIMLKIGREKGRIGRLTLSVNPFIPKPHTPLQWFPMDHVKSLKEKLRYIKKGISLLGNVKIIHELPKWSYIQTLLSRGDRRVGKILLNQFASGENWKAASRQSDLNTDFYVYRKMGLDEILPWDHIDPGVKKEILIREYMEAIRNVA